MGPPPKRTIGYSINRFINDIDQVFNCFIRLINCINR